jgi:hypothetical protein
VIGGVHVQRYPNLTQVVETSGLLGLLLGPGKGRQQHCCQDRDNGNDHKKFDQRKRPPGMPVPGQILLPGALDWRFVPFHFNRLERLTQNIIRFK